MQYRSRILAVFVRIIAVVCLGLVLGATISVNVIAWPSMTQSNTLFQCVNRAVLGVLSFFLMVAHCAPKSWVANTVIENMADCWGTLGCLQLLIGSFMLGYDSSLVSIVDPGSAVHTLLTAAGWLNLFWGFMIVPLGYLFRFNDSQRMPLDSDVESLRSHGSRTSRTSRKSERQQENQDPNPEPETPGRSGNLMSHYFSPPVKPLGVDGPYLPYPSQSLDE